MKRNRGRGDGEEEEKKRERERERGRERLRPKERKKRKGIEEAGQQKKKKRKKKERRAAAKEKKQLVKEETEQKPKRRKKREKKRRRLGGRKKRGRRKRGREQKLCKKMEKKNRAECVQKIGERSSREKKEKRKEKEEEREAKGIQSSKRKKKKCKKSKRSWGEISIVWEEMKLYRKARNVMRQRNRSTKLREFHKQIINSRPGRYTLFVCDKLRGGQSANSRGVESVSRPHIGVLSSSMSRCSIPHRDSEMSFIILSESSVRHQISRLVTLSIWCDAS
ncbi:hypothetical protein ACOSQ3_031975 [Xanthoceras sorbifolium]